MTWGDGVTDRRRFLGFVTAGATTGMVGCADQSSAPEESGGPTEGGMDTDENGGGGGGDTGGSGSDLTCANLTDGYESHDTGAMPVIFDFEYPSIYGSLEEIRTAQHITHEGFRPTADGEVSMNLGQSTQPKEPQGAPDGVDGPTTEFNGETVTFVGSSMPSQVTLTGELPYEIDGKAAAFQTSVALYATSDAGGCEDVLREAAEHLIDSMEVNADTTIESEVDG
jgi:hypothetical protein